GGEGLRVPGDVAVDRAPIHSQVPSHLLEDRVEVLLRVARHHRISLGQAHVESFRRTHKTVQVTPEVDWAPEEANVCGSSGGWRMREAYAFRLPGGAQQRVQDAVQRAHCELARLRCGSPRLDNPLLPE